MALTQVQVGMGGNSNAPAFSAYQNTQQTGIPQFSSTKITFDVKEFDTNNYFASSRFQPLIAGYYQVNAAIQIPYASSSAYILTQLGKNGNVYKTGNSCVGNGSTYPASTISSVVYLNGTTDYVEVYAYGSNGTATFSTQNGLDRTYFNGALVRAA